MKLHSFLAPYLTSYLEFRRKLGYTSFAGAPILYRAQELDQAVQENGFTFLAQLNERFFLQWMFAVPNRSPRTRNMVLGFARGFFNYLIRQGVVRENPTLRIRDLKCGSYPPHVFTLQEIIQILEAARRHRCRFQPQCFLGPTLETLYFLLYACGLRLSEALNLRIQDVDFEENILSLWKTKFHKERLVPFSEHTAEKLKTYLALRLKQFPTTEKTAPFFCHRKGKYTKGIIEVWFRRLLVACGLAKPAGRNQPRPHDLRHAFATHRLYKWYQEGHHILNKLPLLSTYMGHVNIEKTKVYLTVTQALLREGDRRFQAAFEDVVKKFLNKKKKR